MSDDIPIGPGQPCTYCGEGYGLHLPDCNRPIPKIKRRKQKPPTRKHWRKKP